MRGEYPRPEFRRERWCSLNGEWGITLGDQTCTIQVPFAYQCAMSGTGVSGAYDTMRYFRTFRVPEEWNGSRIILHFGAVDYRSQVFVNGSPACSHEGGYTPFSADITPYLTGGEEMLEVRVWDPLNDETIPRGKQFWAGDPAFIWYTPSSGIWQSVWLEPLDEAHIAGIRYDSDVDAGLVRIRFSLSEQCPLPCRLRWQIRVKGEEIYEGGFVSRERNGEFAVDVFHNRILNGSFHYSGLCWFPESPTLFDVHTELESDGQIRDSVDTYFGMRKIHVSEGKIYLNNRPYFQKLVLDQGYWPDSLVTAPSDEAYREDIRRAKEMGFNGCRKHEKAEDPRFLYWADRMGFLVWESMGSFISYTHQAASAFVREWCGLIQRDYSHPCIVVWNVLNESWGIPAVSHDPEQQAFANAMYYLARSLGGNRLVISNDGWEMTETDLVAVHSYRHGERSDAGMQERFVRGLCSVEGLADIMIRKPFAEGYGYKGQPVILSECGGIALAPEGGWGYTSASGAEEFLEEYQRIIRAIGRSGMIQGFCYTQFTDVEQEINGLLRPDRTPKVDPEALRQINDQIETML